MQTFDFISLSKDTAVERICSGAFQQTLKIAISSDEKAWKAAWILNQAAKKCELPFQKYDRKICRAIPGKPSNQKRELLRLLEKIELNEENSGYIFDTAVSCWEDRGAQSSSRMVGFRLIFKIAKRYPELVAEIKSITDEEFLEGLSPGIKRSVLLRLDALD